jgi:hypothetical protein
MLSLQQGMGLGWIATWVLAPFFALMDLERLHDLYNCQN